MELVIKNFEELTNGELYEILKARAEIFVVEQNCIYNDLDGVDKESLHVFINCEDELAAYLRVIPKGVCCDTVKIGRVITVRRGEGFGVKVMAAGLEAAKKRLSADIVTISAQTHAIGFYEKCGFEVVSDVYMEEGIPHVKMVCKL